MLSSTETSPACLNLAIRDEMVAMINDYRPWMKERCREYRTPPWPEVCARLAHFWALTPYLPSNYLNILYSINSPNFSILYVHYICVLRKYLQTVARESQKCLCHIPMAQLPNFEGLYLTSWNIHIETNIWKEHSIFTRRQISGLIQIGPGVIVP